MIYDSLKHLDAYEGISPQITRALKNVPPTMGVEKDENGYPIEPDESDAELRCSCRPKIWRRCALPSQRSLP